MAKSVKLGVGLDVGTMNLVSAKVEKDKVQTARVRDAFLDLEEGAKKMLKISNVDFIDQGEDGVIVIGDAALEMANVFGKEVRRPLSRGLVSAGEIDALSVLGVLVKNVLGEPREENEVCYFSVPAAPVDENRDVVYHKGVFERIVEECGYEAYAGNEAMLLYMLKRLEMAFLDWALVLALVCVISLWLYREWRR